MSPLISVLATKLEAVLAKIHTAISAKLDAEDQAADSLLLEGKSAAEVRADVISNELMTINGRPGEFAIFNEEGVPMALRPTQLLNKIRMVNDDATIDSLKSSSISFSTIFNEWSRISHGSGLASPATPSELTAWMYDDVNDRVVCTANTVSMVGFISKDRFEEYIFETIVKSTNADDDVVGIVLAYKKVGDIEHTLTLLIDAGGLAANSTGITNGNLPKATVAYNFPRTIGIANGTQILYQQAMGIPAQSWGAGADLSAGLKIIAKRKVDKTFEIQVTRVDDSPLPTPIYWTGPIPDLFANACSIGYVAMSQQDSTWQNIRVPLSKEDVIDTRDTTVWKFVNDVWVNNGQFATDPNALQRGLFYKDTVGYGSYFLDLEGDLYKMGGPGTLS